MIMDDVINTQEPLLPELSKWLTPIPALGDKSRLEPIQSFALIQDCKRMNESHDADHGRRAAEKATEWHEQGLLELDDTQLALLVEACADHNDGQVSNDPTIGTCWDADRFDLPRVGITVNERYLSTDAAKHLLYQL